MAKRRINQTIDKDPTELVKSREEFNQFLEKRILIGEELYQRKIQTKEDFKENKEDFYNWCDYNSEYLKHAFNKETNEYKTSFERTGAISISIIGGRQTPNQELKEFKEKIISIKSVSKETLEPIVNNLIKKYETNFKGVGQPLRVALTGSKFGPGLYDIIISLGKEEVEKRLGNKIVI